MTLDLGRLISRAFSISWRHKWLWLLGVFSGGFAGSSVSYSRGQSFSSGSPDLGAVEAQVRAAMHQWLGLALALVAVALVLGVVTLLFNCVAVPASIWAGVHIDAGETVTLGDAWREGRRRFAPYFRLSLIRLAIAVALGIWPLLMLLSALGQFLNGTSVADLFGLLLGAGLLFLLVLFIQFVVNVLLVWSGRVLVLMDLGALDSIAQGWRVLSRGLLDTIVFGLIMWLVAAGLGIALGVAFLAVSAPGLIAFFATYQDFSAVTIAGIGWIVLVGGAVGILGGAWIGSIVQVGYALACRDLLFAQWRGPAAAPASPQPVAPPA